jgi:2-polyprenyl-6-methoxyphenol hydroxylase-like FAD-dependent oxidoreductase
MTEVHDVIIVGAGVSGLMLAQLLDGSALRVLLLEKKSEIRVEPNTFGTFTRTARDLFRRATGQSLQPPDPPLVRRARPAAGQGSRLPKTPEEAARRRALHEQQRDILASDRC